MGLIPEFLGRLPVVVTVDPLGEGEMIRILTEPKNALVRQYKKLFALDNVGARVHRRGPARRRRGGHRLQDGARGLRTIIE
jgi:ATP-dependent Clp protease ATP-binding subunit ClpX